jgi:hypothetical protein
VLGLPYLLVLGALAGALGTRIGWRLRHRLMLPAAQTALGVFAFLFGWNQRGATGGALAVGAWAIGTSVAAIPAFRAARDQLGTRVLGFAPYAASMRGWLASGEMLGASPSAILRRHVRELAFYLAAALVSANLLAIGMGAVLLNRMNAWFVELCSDARDRRTILLLGWPCWSLARVLAYVALGAACAQWWAARLGRAAPPEDVLGLINLGLLGVVVDITLKIQLSGWYARKLHAALAR